MAPHPAAAAVLGSGSEQHAAVEGVARGGLGEGTPDAPAHFKERLRLPGEKRLEPPLTMTSAPACARDSARAMNLGIARNRHRLAAMPIFGGSMMPRADADVECCALRWV